jgi:peroxiredoxin
MNNPDHPLQPGEAAPRFELPAVHRDGTVSLEEYCGKGAVMVALFRGLHCPFCRRHIARLAVTQEKLAQAGVATLAIVNSQLDRARQYFRYRPVRMDVASDPDVRTHRAFGVNQLELLPDAAPAHEVQWPKSVRMSEFMGNEINPTGELPRKMNLMAASEVLNKLDDFEVTPSDQQMMMAHGSQFNSQFLIDPKGVIRWAFIEARNGMHEMFSYPAEDEIMAAARAVAR